MQNPLWQGGLVSETPEPEPSTSYRNAKLAIIGRLMLKPRRLRSRCGAVFKSEVTVQIAVLRLIV
jgi:hypothetical protein